MYVPYIGPNGPDKKQINANNEALCQALREANNEAAIVPDPENSEESVVLCNGKYVAYDRWGFCDTGLDLDQASFDETFVFLFVKTKKITVFEVIQMIGSGKVDNLTLVRMNDLMDCPIPSKEARKMGAGELLSRVVCECQDEQQFSDVFHQACNIGC